jgi:hypothetical protein
MLCQPVDTIRAFAGHALPMRHKSKIASLEIQRRLELERFQKRQDEKATRKRKNRVRSGRDTSLGRRVTPSQVQIRRNRQWLDVDVPVSLDLFANRQVTCQLFSTIRGFVRDGRRVKLVFERTENISAEALMYMLGQVQRLQIEHGADHLTGTYPASKKVERLLEESGFFHVLRVHRRGAVVRRSRATRFLKCRTDRNVHGAEIPSLRDELLGTDLRMPAPVGRKVFRALTEAMTNVHHHAYHQKSVRNRELTGRWWLGAQLSLRKNRFTLTFYDAGVGIPKTLPRKYGWEAIRGVLSLLPGISPDDGQMIRAAMELGRSRTGSDNRGKGLLDLLKLIDEVGGGTLHIFSRCGWYCYTPGGEAVQNDEHFVEGTLIKWELPLDMAVIKLVEVPLDDLDDNQD